MKVLYDTNILLDVFQFRQPHYRASAKSLNLTSEGKVTGYFPAHAVATLDYILSKYSDRQTVRKSVAWVLEFLEIIPCEKPVLDCALDAPMMDFEDAIVAQCARSASCDHIVTRNPKDFVNSPVRATTPGDFLIVIQE